MGEFVLFGDQLYLVPDGMLSFENLKVILPGLHLGTMKKNRSEPSHALAMSLKGDQVKHKYSLDKDSLEILAFLKGNHLVLKVIKDGTW
ncbi:RsmF rRNA methyltransferase first C-terminal domain-containing protein [Neobacillus mesonae]|nr:RsmF rRNA methyltransferase first C-terminal domain-containing protein [Neobacillus mesonae]